MKIAAPILAVLIALPAVAVAAPLAKPADFAICGACHKVEAGAPNGIGPNLWGISGRLSGTVPGFAYSPAMKAAKIKWNKKDLVAYLQDPKGRIPGNKMPYAGQKDPVKAATIADYVLSLK